MKSSGAEERRARTVKVLSIPCATCGADLKLVGSACRNALNRLRAYCPPPAECRKVGKSARLSAANRARYVSLSPADVAQMAKLVAQDGVARIPLRGRSGAVRAYAMVDPDLEPILAAFTWQLDGSGYARRKALGADGKRKGISMHRQIMDAPAGLQVDHRDRNRLNNQKANLRLVDHARQQQNRSKRKTHNGQPTSSKHRGVTWDASRMRWQARVMVGGVRVLNQCFKDEREAAVAAFVGRLLHMSHANA